MQLPVQKRMFWRGPWYDPPLLESLELEEGEGYIAWAPQGSLDNSGNNFSFLTHFSVTDARGNRTGELTKIRCPTGKWSELVRLQISISHPFSHDFDASADDVPTLSQLTLPILYNGRVPPPPPPIMLPPFPPIQPPEPPASPTSSC